MNSLSQTIQKSVIERAYKFAVVFCGNHQYKVSPGDVIVVQRLRAEIGSQIRLQKVLMIGGPRFTAIGRPLLERAIVSADVEEQKRMRNVVSLFATPGRRRVRWVDAPHAATVLRIRSISFTPEILGELDKYNMLGNAGKRNLRCSEPNVEDEWKKDNGSSSVHHPLLQPISSFDHMRPLNPVYPRCNGYHLYEKKSTEAVECAGPVNISALGSMEMMLEAMEGEKSNVETLSTEK